MLEALSDDARCGRFEGAFTQQLLRVYDLQPERVRLEDTTASGYWRVTEDGLFQFGHSKDHRPDLPQVKVMLSVLDPLGLPVATDVVPGQRADDPLYLPAIARVRGEHGAARAALCRRLQDGGAGDPDLAPGWWRLLPVSIGRASAATGRAGELRGGRFHGAAAVHPHHASDRYRHAAAPRGRLRTAGAPDRPGGWHPA